MRARISASAVGDRGLMIHLKGRGNLIESKKCFSALLLFNYDYPYDSIPFVNSGLSLRVFPWSSTPGLMSYTARTQDAMEYNELSLKYLPGHILEKIL